MSTMNLKDAKVHFIESGRLNRNVVRDDISISWYKCRLSQLSINQDGTTCQNNKKIKTTSKFDPGFIDFLDSIIPVSYDFVIADVNHIVLYHRFENHCVKTIQCIEENCIGTNAGALSLKTGQDQIVIKHEHYLNSWTDAYSYGIPIFEEDNVIGTIMLISNFHPPELDVRILKEKLKQFEMRRTKTIEGDMKELCFEDYFTYPREVSEKYDQSLKRLPVNNTPVMIIGEKGSGKTTLAWYLCLTNGLSPYFIDGNNIPHIMERDIVRNALYQYDTIVIENFEKLSDENKQLLTVYTEEKIISKSSEKFSNFNALNIILTTDYNSKSGFDKTDKKLTNRYSMNIVNLKNLDEFKDDIREVIKKMMDRYKLRITDDAVDIIVKNEDITSFKALIKYFDKLKQKNKEKLSIGMSDLIYKEESVYSSLEENEKEYINKVFVRMNGNISATAEVLKIGRSTLYRKLEKYRIDTFE